MIYILIAIFVTVIASQIKTKTEKESARITCFVIATCLFVISAGKSIEKARFTDLINYKNMYLSLKYLSWEKILQGIKEGSVEDFGFSIFSKIASDKGLSPEGWMAVIALLFALSVSWFIYKQSHNPCMSVLVVVAFYYTFTFTGLRQTMALVAIMLAYNCIVEKKIIPYLIFCTIAWTFHSTAIFFIPAYWISKQKIGKKQMVYIVVALIIVFVSPNIFRRIIELIAWNEKYESYSTSTVSLSWSGYIIQFLIIIFCFLFRNAVPKERRWKDIDAFLNCMVIGLCFQGFTAVIAESFRMSYYYSICSIAAIPNIISHMNYENKKIATISIGLILIMYAITSSGYNYFVFFD